MLPLHQREKIGRDLYREGKSIVDYGVKMPLRMTEEDYFSNDSTVSLMAVPGYSGDYSQLNFYLQKHDRYTAVFRHSHEFFEVFLVLSGACVCSIGGTEGVAFDERALRLPFPAGSLVFIAPDTAHTMEVFDESLVINFLIRKSTFDSIFRRLLQDQGPLGDFFMSGLFPGTPLLHTTGQCLSFNTGRDKTLLDELFAMMLEQRRADRYSAAIMENRLEIYFSLLLRRYADTARIHSGPVTEGRYRNLLKYIEENYRRVSISELSAGFGITPSYVSRMVKRLSGMTFQDFVGRLRDREAMALLRDTKERVGDIAYTLGYENEESFVRAFRKRQGITPGRYRRMR
jgi:AraC-like DNA-binding protein